MFSIGEFSKITGLPIKTLRFYHEQGILLPSRVETGSGYRYYNASRVEVARVVTALRSLDFSIAEISEIMRDHEDDATILDYLQGRRKEIKEKIRRERSVVQQLDNIISHEREAQAKMNQSEFKVDRKELEPQLVATLRMKGRYSDCGKGFGKIGRSFGRKICGKAMMLHHDAEYREQAEFDVAMPIKNGSSTDEITVQTISGGECLSLMHLGPYEELGRSYQIIMDYAENQSLRYTLPTREVYHKGPGMIFRGNPQRYLTEIQLMLDL